MTEYPKAKLAKLAYLTRLEPEQWVLNVIVGKKYSRVEISREQLSNLAVDSVSMILRHARAE